MTEEQKFFFDLRGWLLLPAVLSGAECEVVKQHLISGGNGFTTPARFTGPAHELLDHPALVDVLTEILGMGRTFDDYYNFRCEGSFITIRQAGWKPDRTDVPHGGAGIDAQAYRTNGKQIYSGLTRVVWELNPVEQGDGGTLFLSGSHKANLTLPESVCQPDNSHLESYSCPAGSVFIFTESLLHAATTWKNPHVERISIFNCYSSLLTQYHRLNVPHELIASMPPKRQSLFRGVWGHDFNAEHLEEGANRYYSLDNRSL